MKTTLNYTHARSLFIKNEFKPFVRKYFLDVKFLGFDSGNWGPSISVSNWDAVKELLPKYAIPESIS